MALIRDLTLSFDELVARLPKRSRSAVHQKRHYAKKAAATPSEPSLEVGAEVRWDRGRRSGIVAAIGEQVTVTELRRIGPPIAVTLRR
jgi:hypothetical protein